GHMEVYHLVWDGFKAWVPLESIASGWGMEEYVAYRIEHGADGAMLRRLADGKPITARVIAEAAKEGDSLAADVLNSAIYSLALAISHVIALLCPRRIVIGGGVSLIGEEQFFQPIRQEVARHVFKPFKGITDIVPAALGEAVVVHGALALARQRL